MQEMFHHRNRRRRLHRLETAALRASDLANQVSRQLSAALTGGAIIPPPDRS
jgi:hypothetical protein